MTCQEEELWFERISAAQNNQVSIIPLLNLTGRQSIQMSLPCGCFAIDQYMAEEHEDVHLSMDRKLLYEFCATHQHIPSPKTQYYA